MKKPEWLQHFNDPWAVFASMVIAFAIGSYFFTVLWISYVISRAIYVVGLLGEGHVGAMMDARSAFEQMLAASLKPTNLFGERSHYNPFRFLKKRFSR